MTNLPPKGTCNVSMSKIYLKMLQVYLRLQGRYLPEDWRQRWHVSTDKQLLDAYDIPACLDYLSHQPGLDNIGLLTGSNIQPANLRPFSDLITNVPDVRQAFKLFCKYQASFHRGVQFTTRETDQHFEFAIQGLGPRDHQFISLVFSGVWRMLVYLAGPVPRDFLQAVSVHFQSSELNELPVYQQVLEAPVFVDQKENKLVFNKRILDVPVYLAQDDSYKQAMEKLFANTDDHSGLEFQSQVLTHLRRRPEGALPDIDSIASHFYMSQSKLKKKLSEQGLSYTDLCDQVKKEQAVIKLEQPELSLKQIACDLGFSNASAFNKAFKRWEGVTPGAYRKERNTA